MEHPESVEQKEEGATGEPAALDIVPPGTPERLAAKDRIRLAYISGKSTLAHMAIVERVPYNTIMQWSAAEKWAEKRAAIAQRADIKATENIAEWVAQQRTDQIKRSITRSGQLQSLIDKAAKNASESEDGLMPADVQALASAEERADNIVRRNLGMDGEARGGSGVTVNVLGGDVQLA